MASANRESALSAFGECVALACLLSVWTIATTKKAFGAAILAAQSVAPKLAFGFASQPAAWTAEWVWAQARVVLRV